MQHPQPNQCDICFQPYGPFSTMRVLPVTPIITLSGTATPTHVRTPGEKISICRYCLQCYSNLEPWTDPADSADTLDIPNVLAIPDSLATSGTPDSLEAPGFLAIADTSDSPEILDTPSHSPSLPVHEPDPRLSNAQPFPTLSSPEGLCHLFPSHAPGECPVSCASLSVCKFASFTSFPLCQRTRPRSPPPIPTF
jgi:hypothetical protein